MRGVAKMEDQEDPELTSSQGHTKITTIYRATIDEKNWKTSRKGFLQLKIKRKNHNETVGGEEKWYCQDLYPGVGDSQMGR